MSLAGGAAIIWLLFGVTTGVVSALKRGSPVDRTSMGIALAGVSLPIFFTGLLSLAIFRDNLKLFPGAGTYVGLTQNPLAWASNLVLPWVTLAFLYAALYARLTRAGMLETMGEDYIRTARAKGLPERTVVVRHALRADAHPGADHLRHRPGHAARRRGADRGDVLPARARQVRHRLDQQQRPADGCSASSMVGAFFIVLANLVVDVLYAVIDPRVRLS